MKPKGHLCQHEELERQAEERTRHTTSESRDSRTYTPHECVGVVAPEEGGVSGIATAHDDVHAPHKRDEVEHNQAARVIVLTGLHLGQM